MIKNQEIKKNNIGNARNENDSNEFKADTGPLNY